MRDAYNAARSEEPGCYTKKRLLRNQKAQLSTPDSRGFWSAPNFIWADKRPPVQVADIQGIMRTGLRSLFVIQIGDCYAIRKRSFLHLIRVAFDLRQISFGQTKGHPFRWPICIIRHLASFPQSSIIAPTRLDFCVRNGNRYFPGGMDTEVRL